jgi:hypothetical protein
MWVNYNLKFIFLYFCRKFSYRYSLTMSKNFLVMVQNVIITMGAKGALMRHRKELTLNLKPYN